MEPKSGCLLTRFDFSKGNHSSVSPAQMISRVVQPTRFSFQSPAKRRNLASVVNRAQGCGNVSRFSVRTGAAKLFPNVFMLYSSTSSHELLIGKQSLSR